MSHKCFISFKTEDIEYKEKIQEMDELDIIDKSLNDPIDSDDEDYIMKKIREDYLNDSTVTICLIGNHSAENSTSENQSYIKRELQASLYNKPNGVLGIVLPNMYDKIYKGKYTCSECGQKHNFVNINNDTTIREFNYNYYLPLSDDKCAWSESDRYCVLVKWDDFVASPNNYIEKADDIASKIKVYPY